MISRSIIFIYSAYVWLVQRFDFNRQNANYLFKSARGQLCFPAQFKFKCSKPHRKTFCRILRMRSYKTVVKLRNSGLPIKPPPPPSGPVSSALVLLLLTGIFLHASLSNFSECLISKKVLKNSKRLNIKC